MHDGFPIPFRNQSMTDTPTDDDSSSAPTPDDENKNADGHRKPPERRDDNARHEKPEERAIRFRRYLAFEIARRILAKRRGLVGPDEPPRG
jgi:hypothetical protein